MAQKAITSISVNCDKRNKVQQSATSSEIHGSIDPSKINESHRFSTGLIGWMAQKLHKAWHFADQNILQGETSGGGPFLRRTSWKQTVGKTYMCTYCGWKKSCTTLDGWNPMNNGINMDKPSINWCRISQPSTVCQTRRTTFRRTQCDLMAVSPSDKKLLNGTLWWCKYSQLWNIPHLCLNWKTGVKQVLQAVESLAIIKPIGHRIQQYWSTQRKTWRTISLSEFIEVQHEAWQSPQLLGPCFAQKSWACEVRSTC